MKSKKLSQNQSVQNPTSHDALFNEINEDINWSGVNEEIEESGALTIDFEPPKKRRGRPPGSTTKNTRPSDSIYGSGNMSTFPDSNKECPVGDDPSYNLLSNLIDDSGTTDEASQRRARRQKSEDYIKRRFLYDEHTIVLGARGRGSHQPGKRGRKRGSSFLQNSGHPYSIGMPFGPGFTKARRGRPPKNRGGLVGRPIIHRSSVSPINNKFNRQSNYVGSGGTVDFIDSYFAGGLSPPLPNRRFGGYGGGSRTRDLPPDLVDLNDLVPEILPPVSSGFSRRRMFQTRDEQQPSGLDVDEYGDFDGSVFEELEIPNDYIYSAAIQLEDMDFSEPSHSQSQQSHPTEEVVDDEEFMFAEDATFSTSAPPSGTGQTGHELFSLISRSPPFAPSTFLVSQSAGMSPAKSVVVTSSSYTTPVTSANLQTARRRKSPLKPIDGPGRVSVRLTGGHSLVMRRPGDLGDSGEVMYRVVKVGGSSLQARHQPTRVTVNTPSINEHQMHSVLKSHAGLRPSGGLSSTADVPLHEGSTSMPPPVSTPASAAPPPTLANSSAVKRAPIHRPSILRSKTTSNLSVDDMEAAKETSGDFVLGDIPNVSTGQGRVVPGSAGSVVVHKMMVSGGGAPRTQLTRPNLPRTETASAYLMEKKRRAQLAVQKQQSQSSDTSSGGRLSSNTLNYDTSRYASLPEPSLGDSSALSDYDMYRSNIYWSDHEPQIKERREKVITQDMIDQRPRQAIRKYYSTLKKHLSRQERKTVSPAPFWQPTAAPRVPGISYESTQPSSSSSTSSTALPPTTVSARRSDSPHHPSSPPSSQTTFETYPSQGSTAYPSQKSIQNYTSVLRTVGANKHHFKVVLLDDPSGHQEAILVSNPPSSIPTPAPTPSTSPPVSSHPTPSTALPAPLPPPPTPTPVVTAPPPGHSVLRPGRITRASTAAASQSASSSSPSKRIRGQSDRSLLKEFQVQSESKVPSGSSTKSSDVIDDPLSI